MRALCPANTSLGCCHFNSAGLSEDDILIMMPFIILFSAQQFCELADLFGSPPFILPRVLVT